MRSCGLPPSQGREDGEVSSQLTMARSLLPIGPRGGVGGRKINKQLMCVISPSLRRGADFRKSSGSTCHQVFRGMCWPECGPSGSARDMGQGDSAEGFLSRPWAYAGWISERETSGYFPKSIRECKYLDSDLCRIQSAGDPQDWIAETDTAGADDKLPPIGWQRTEMANAIIYQTGKQAASKRIRMNMMAETIRKSRRAIPMQRIRRLLCRQRGIRLCTCR